MSKRFLSCLLALILVLAAAVPALAEDTAKRELNIVAVKVSTVEDYETNDFTLWLEEKTGIHINFNQIPDDSASEKVAMLIAGGDLPDAFLGFGLSTDALLQYGQSGILLPLDDLLEEHAPNFLKAMEYYEQGLDLIRQADGHIYSLPSINPCYHCTYAEKMWINTTWLDNLGLEVPTTLDEFTEVLRAFRDQDANGNGDPSDEIPLAGSSDGWYTQSCNFLINSFLYFTDSKYGFMLDDDKQVYFDADEWVRFAKECGMEYLVVTSKHHDGFALFKSKASAFNMADATPFGRDVIAELAEACAKHGLNFGLYYSQDLDWHEPNGGGYLSEPIGCSGTAWDNNWDFPDQSAKDFDVCFREKIEPQVEELLRNYGELCVLWFDMPMTLREEHSRRLFNLIKRYQPECLINSRMGNGAYDYVSLCDNEIPESMPEHISADVDMNGIVGFKPSPYGLYETPATLNDSWGYCAWDQNWKSAEKVAEIRNHLNSMGINYLLNVGPDGLGRIPVASQEILRKAAKL